MLWLSLSHGLIIPSLSCPVLGSIGSQSATVSHVMSAHLEVIEADILGALGQLPFLLHSRQEKQTAATVQDERGRFYTD